MNKRGKWKCPGKLEETSRENVIVGLSHYNHKGMLNDLHFLFLNMYLQGEWMQFSVRPLCFYTAAVGKAEQPTRATLNAAVPK